MSLIEQIKERRDEILEIARQHGASHVRVFGSVARGQETERSDVDVLVRLEPGRSLLDLIGLEQDLAQCLGRDVDVQVDGGLSPYLEEHILAGATAI